MRKSSWADLFCSQALSAVSTGASFSSQGSRWNSSASRLLRLNSLFYQLGLASGYVSDLWYLFLLCLLVPAILGLVFFNLVSCDFEFRVFSQDSTDFIDGILHFVFVSLSFWKNFSAYKINILHWDMMWEHVKKEFDTTLNSSTKKHLL